MYEQAITDIQTLMHHGMKKDILTNYSSKKELHFNGIGENEHESFVLHLPAKEEFDFCKTNHKPYDKYVTAALIVLKDYLGKHVDVSSDGESSEWLDGIDLACIVLNRNFYNPIRKEA